MLELFSRALVVSDALFLRLELPGEPGHKARHRSRIVSPKNKKPFVHHYPDPDTAAYEKALAQLAAILMRRRKPTERPVSLLIEARKSIPKSWTKRERADALAGALLPTGRPDADNYLKIVDALNEIVWKDDAQIISATVVKRYVEQACLRIEVREFIEPT